jgi:deferrochelatase/peroxidase EfeB
VEEFRKYLKSISSCSEEEELIAAKMMGRWRSGAPLARCPLHDDPALGADPKRNNDFLYKQDDPIGYKTPPGSHIRRMNPRDSDVAGVVRLHRMIQRGTAFSIVFGQRVVRQVRVEVQRWDVFQQTKLIRILERCSGANSAVARASAH